MSDKMEIATKPMAQLFMDIKIQLEKVSGEQIYIIKQLESLEKRCAADGEEIKKLNEIINKMLNRTEFKKELKKGFLDWFRITPIVIGLLVAALTSYISYETGLYKPVPVSVQQQK